MPCYMINYKSSNYYYDDYTRAMLKMVKKLVTDKAVTFKELHEYINVFHYINKLWKLINYLNLILSV